MKVRKKYTRELHRQLGYFATWLPGTPLALGDIGVMKGKEFIKIGNLSDDDFKIDFDIEYDTEPNSIKYTSEGNVVISTKLEGTEPEAYNSLKPNDIGFDISFSSKNSILFEAKGTLNHTIRDQIKLGNTILDLYKKGKWDKDFVVITELVVADSATIIISSERNASAEIKATNASANSILSLSDRSLGLNFVYQKSLHTKILAESGLTPLFRASKVKTPWFGTPNFEVNKVRSIIATSVKKSVIKNDKTIFAEVTVEDTDDFDFA